MVSSAILGFPRIGPQREVKKALEAYWSGKINQTELLKQTKQQRILTYEYIKQAGVDIIPTGTFSLYDHVLDMANTFNLIPSMYKSANLDPIDTYFAMARGHQNNGIDLPAQEMKKWFDSNYHYIVPELNQSTQILLNNHKPIDDYLEAKQLGYNARPVLIGPITLLSLSKASKHDTTPTFNPMSVLPKLVPIYCELLLKLVQAGAEWVQIDEPILVLDNAQNYINEFKSTYNTIMNTIPSLKIMLTTYFGSLDDNIDIIKSLPIAGLHIDLDRAPHQLDSVLNTLSSTNIIISLGLVSGRNIWKTDLQAALNIIQKSIQILGSNTNRIQIASSSSLLHTPITLENENKIKPDILDWFSFAKEKLVEVAILATAIRNPSLVSNELTKNAISIKKRRDYEQNSDPAVRQRVAAIKPDDLKRKSPFSIRKEIQKKHLNLPLFPTTTIGSFPQTKEIRLYRARYNKGEITLEEYESFLKQEIKLVVQRQEQLGLDVLVHGEPERNDMVQYFGELLEGFAFTQNGWVQSYGSRYVRPPIIVSDISRPQPMTIKWSAYAQSLTNKPMKGMLTGPVTILNWSFPRADISKEIQSKQIALALRDEVIDLETIGGIKSVQVDEPAIREGLPLRQKDWSQYLRWAVDSFRLATSGVSDAMNIASHFCYSQFDQIMSSIIELDADMISIEHSKSGEHLLNAFRTVNYPSHIGPGVFDIHSPRVPSKDEMVNRIKSMTLVLPKESIWVNPDCGLKTRTWDECMAQLTNLVAAAQECRKTLV